MRELKLQMNVYSPRDYRRIERHLADMAAKGWMIEQPDSLFWRYRLCQPQKLRFSVLFFQNLDWEPPYRQHAEKAGWKFVTDYVGLQIFCTEDPDLAPIEMDATPRWKAIHKTVKNTDRNRWFGFCFLALMVLANTVFATISDPVEVLADGPRLMYTLLMLGMLLFVAVDALHYYTWRNKARRQYQNQGIFPEPKGIFQGLCIGFGILLALLTVTLVIEDRYGRVVTLLNIGSIVIALLAAVGYRLIKKKRSAAAPVSKPVTIGIALAVFLLLGIVQSALLQDYDFTCPPEEMDLTVQALTGESAREQSCLVEEQYSLLLADLTGRNVVLDGEGQISLQYRITKAVRPGLVQFTHSHCLPVNLQEKTEPQDPALWQAEGVWLYPGSNGVYTYFIYYSDRAATLMTSWELTDAQVAIATVALKNA